jgi:peptide/nickel transport system permease protein
VLPGALRAAGMLAATSVLAFAMLHAMPGDPAEIALAQWNIAATPETIGALRRQWGLDRNLIQQYLAWLGRFASGDWGVSFRTGRPILTEMLDRLPVSAGLGFGGIALASVLAVPLGFLSGLRAGSVADHAVRAVNVLTQSVPVFWLALVLLWLLGVKLQLMRPFAAEGAARFALPVLLLAVYSLGSLASVYRTELLAQRGEPHFLAARAKGLSEPRALWSHAHRAALYSLVAAVGPEFGWVVGGTAVAEIVFALNGIGQFLVQSVSARDYFVLQAYVVVVAAWMVLVRFGIEASLRLLEPRLRP